VSLPLGEPDLSTGRVLSRDPRMLAVGRHHPLAQRDVVSVEDLADYAVGDLDIVAPKALIEEMVPRRTPTGRPIPRIPVRAEEPSTLIMAVASGRVVQPVTDAFATTYAHPDVSYIPIADLPASDLIDRRIAETGGWRGETLSRMRRLIKEADPEVVEEWKWGIPVWSRGGIICTGETYKAKVKLTFAKGASVKDPKKLFNSSLDGGTRRAIDIGEGEEPDAAAFKALIRAAVAVNKKAK